MNLQKYEVITKLSDIYKLTLDETSVIHTISETTIDLEKFADEMGVSIENLNKLLKNIYKKMKIKNRVELMALILNVLDFYMEEENDKKKKK